MYEEALLPLFSYCSQCKLPAHITKFVSGTFVRIKQVCHFCETENTWNSQPFINNIPAGNILLSASILFSGSLPEKALRIFKFLGCASISRRTFFNHQDKFLLPAIHNIWERYQQAFIVILKAENSPLTLGGDGRADSPGHCAKFGAYSVMELKHKMVLDIQLVQVECNTSECISINVATTVFIIICLE